MSCNGFHLYTRNNLYDLLRAYSKAHKKDLLQFRKDDSVFTREEVAVATRGMALWLGQQLVHEGHVVANFDFPFTRASIDRILADYAKAKAPDMNYRPELFTQEVLVWRIYRILCNESQEATDPMAVLYNYLEHDRNVNAKPDLRRYQLALKLAGLYYDYMSFIPDKLEQTGIQPPEGDWQLALWHKLCLDAQGNLLVSHARLMLDFLADESLAELPDEGWRHPVTFFGVSAMCPFFLKVLKKYGTVAPVNFFYLNHCDEFWGDVESPYQQARRAGKKLVLPQTEDIEMALAEHYENTLLCKYGQQGRDFFNAVMMLDDDIYEHSTWETGKVEEQEESKAILPTLKDIQRRILSRTDPGKDVPSLPSWDDSLTFHSCFNKVREIESLRDCLVKLLDSYQSHGKSLTLNDIIVMAPDISEYASTISAVFDNDALLKGKYSISDRSIKTTNMISEAFLSVMGINKGKFELSHVNRLLDSEPLRRRFGFDDDDVATIRTWFRKAGIRWGQDGESRKDDFGGQAVEAYSWREGLDRLLLKQVFDNPAMASVEEIPETNFDALLPADISSGKDQDGVLGGLCRLYQELCEFSDSVKQKEAEHANGAVWCDFLKERQERFFRADSDSSLDYSCLGRSISTLRATLETAGCLEKTISYEVVYAAMTASLETPAPGEPFMNGKITFCSLLPMRGIPCKVIALIGMDIGMFPRRDSNVNFNLVSRYKAAAVDKDKLLFAYTRSRSQEDRFTFLEALMSAQDYLMVFYQGQDDHTLKDDLLPAAPVKELMEYAQAIRNWGDKGGLVVRHSLNAFDAEAFAKVPSTDSQDCSGLYTGVLRQPFSYDANMWEVVQAVADSGRENSEDASPLWKKAFSLPIPEKLPFALENGALTLDIEDLARFLKDASSAFLCSRLGFAKNAYEEDSLTDYEPFAIDKLNSTRQKTALGPLLTYFDEVPQVNDGQVEYADATKEQQSTLQSLNKLLTAYKANGVLPIGGMADKAFQAEMEEAFVDEKTFREDWNAQERKEPEEHCIDLGEIPLKLEDDKLLEALKGVGIDTLPQSDKVIHVKLTGCFKALMESRGEQDSRSQVIGYISRVYASRMSGQHYIQPYLRHLMLCAECDGDRSVWSQYMQGKTIYNINDPGNGYVFQMRNLAQLYLLGHLMPLPIFGKYSAFAACLRTQGNDGSEFLKEDLSKQNDHELYSRLDAGRLSGKWKTLVQTFAEYCYGAREAE